MKNFKYHKIKNPRNGRGEFIKKHPWLDELANYLGALWTGTFITYFVICGSMLYFIGPVEVEQPLPAISVAHSQTKQGTIREITMYSSTPEQTDSSPCIAANNQDICVLWAKGQNLCATNAFPFGTELEVDKLGSCLVVDRMNSRFSNRIDWYAGYDNACLDGVDDWDYCPTYQRALNFGIQNLLVTVK